MKDSWVTARRMWTLYEPVHVVTYFAPEARKAFEAAGLRGFWRGYFAGRAAPLGAAAAPLVIPPPRGWATRPDHLLGRPHRRPRAPAALGRLGPVSAAQALSLAVLAVPDPAAQWRVILTDPAGQATAVDRVRRGWLCGNPGRPPGLTGRVTVTIPAATLSTSPGADRTGESGTSPAGKESDRGTGRGIRAAVLRAARRAAARAAETAAADAAAGGCAHTHATPAYRPATRTREHVTARDQTCRQPHCGQPAWRADLDHTRPWHQGGPTCPCNLGSSCRTHHQIKQNPGWTLTQPAPGTFTWTTPAGRTYTTTPDPYPA